MDDSTVYQSLGELHGKLDMVIQNQNELKDDMRKMADRQNDLDKRTAISSFTTSSVVSVGIALIIEKAKHFIS